MNGPFPHLAVLLCQHLPLPELLLLGQRLEATLDSMPITMARGSWADSAKKMAAEVADKGFATLKTYGYMG